MALRLKRNFWPLFLLAGLVILSQSRLWFSGWWQNHDPASVLRLQALEECFADGQLPCRWTTQFGGGFGLPLFNYYAPFFYLVAYGGRLLGLSLAAALKLSLFIFGLSGVWGLYLLLRNWLTRAASFAAAWAWGWAPFVALEIFVRGDLSEMAALWLVPVVFLACWRLTERVTVARFVLLTSLTAGFCLTHNLQLIIFAPLIAAWGLLLMVRSRRGWVFLSLSLGVGLAAFFWGPVLLERNLVQLDSLKEGYFDFHHHFLGGRQLFFGRQWGFGVSEPGTEADFSLQLGWPHWWPLMLLPFAWLRLKKNWRPAVVVLSLLWLGSLLMMTRYSLPVWERLPFLAFFQFPWRWLGLTTLLTCVLAGLVVEVFAKQSRPGQRPLIFVFLVLVAGLNFGYFRPEGRVTVNEAFLVSQRWASVTDYLPKTVQRLPDFTAGWPLIRPSQSLGRVNNFEYYTNYFKAEAEIWDDQPAELWLPVFDFPGWEIYVDEDLTISGYLYPAVKKSNEFGLLAVELGKGQHQVTGWLRPTNGQKLGQAVSLISLAIFWGAIFWLGRENGH